jgi:hypothetical protein
VIVWAVEAESLDDEPDDEEFGVTDAEADSELPADDDDCEARRAGSASTTRAKAAEAARTAGARRLMR